MKRSDMLKDIEIIISNGLKHFNDASSIAVFILEYQEAQEVFREWQKEEEE